MSGFSKQWLDLREPVDHRSVDAGLRARLCQSLAPKANIVLTDLGSGSGSSLRALAPYLPQRQTWRLTDHDPALLDHARQTLGAWADKAHELGDRLCLESSDRSIEVEFVQTDLARGVPHALLAGADAVTASAFFDLVSPAWIAQFAASLGTLRLPMYAALTYDGTEIWQPPHNADRAILAAFHADQHRDKGFGPAAGPDAVGILRDCFANSGYEVLLGASPWRLDRQDNQLISALANGSAAALAASGYVSASDVESWRQARISARSCKIGHADILALPRKTDQR